MTDRQWPISENNEPMDQLTDEAGRRNDQWPNSSSIEPMMTAQTDSWRTDSGPLTQKAQPRPGPRTDPVWRDEWRTARGKPDPVDWPQWRKMTQLDPDWPSSWYCWPRLIDWPIIDPVITDSCIGDWPMTDWANWVDDPDPDHWRQTGPEGRTQPDPVKPNDPAKVLLARQPSPDPAKLSPDDPMTVLTQLLLLIIDYYW